MRDEFDVMIIGGGATGGGVALDLALRGLKVALVERADLTDGTSGRYHGLLHSGGRYAVRDPESARECIEENRILRRIVPHAIEDTGGLFIQTPDDDPAYADKWVAACRAAGIEAEELSIAQMLREEPALNPPSLVPSVCPMPRAMGSTCSPPWRGGEACWAARC